MHIDDDIYLCFPHGVIDGEGTNSSLSHITITTHLTQEANLFKTQQAAAQWSTTG
jgi:hypothetical protein